MLFSHVSYKMVPGWSIGWLQNRLWDGYRIVTGLLWDSYKMVYGIVIHGCRWLHAIKNNIFMSLISDGGVVNWIRT